MTPNKRLLDIEEKLARGQKIEIDPLQIEDEAKLQHFFRHYRNQTFYVPDFKIQLSQKIENIRNDLRLRRFDQAASQIEQIDFDEKSILKPEELELLAEAKIEKCRLFNFRQQISEALELSESLLHDYYLSSLSRTTVHQLRADMFLKKADFENAENSARLAAQESLKFPLASNRFSSLSFLAITKAHRGLEDEALMLIDELIQEVQLISQDSIWADRMLTVQRGRFRAFQVLGHKDEMLSALNSATLLARWCEHQETLARCQADLLLLQSKNLNMVLNESQPPDQFTWHSELKVLFDWQRRTIYRFEEQSIQAKILDLWFSGVHDFGVIFTKIWKMPYNKERHGNLIRTHFYKLRKKIPGFSELQRRELRKAHGA